MTQDQTPDDPQQDQPKIIVDDDWKSQAQAERAKLAETERQAQQQAGQAGADPAQPGLPKEANFQTLLTTLAFQALMYLGAFPDESGRAMVSLEHAKLHIDLLDVLEKKTAGNLTDEETKDLQQVLSDLRLRFVEITKAVANMPPQDQPAAGPTAHPTAPTPGPQPGPGMGPLT